jgi:hypothetical protein
MKKALGDAGPPTLFTGPCPDQTALNEPPQATAPSDALATKKDSGAPPERQGRRPVKKKVTRPRRGAPVKLLVRVDLETLMRGFPVAGETCELVGYGPISVAAVKELIRDGDPFVAAILCKGKQVVGVAHHGRSPNAWQRSALEWLYPTCAVKGCPAPGEHLEIDHRVDWAATHITLLEWLDGLCTHHHDLKTRYNWALVEGFGKRAFVPPTDPRHPQYQRVTSNVAV